MPAVYYNIYRSVSAMGPWELVNATPIKDVPAGNEYTASDLVNGQLYYIMIVGGRFDDETGLFVPICGQPIKPTPDSGSDVLNPNIVLVRPKRISSVATATLGLSTVLLATGSV